MPKLVQRTFPFSPVNLIQIMLLDVLSSPLSKSRWITNFSYAHLIFHKLLVFSPLLLWLCQQRQKAAFSVEFARSDSWICSESLLYIAVNYYICNFKYTIWGLDPWNSNLLFFFYNFFLPSHIFSDPAKRRKMENFVGVTQFVSFIRFKLLFFFSYFSATKGICLDYWIASKSNMWWRQQRKERKKSFVI